MLHPLSTFLVSTLQLLCLSLFSFYLLLFFWFMDELNEGIHSKKYICWSTRAIQRSWVVLSFTYYLKLYPARNNYFDNERNLTYMLLHSNNISETRTHLNSDYFSSVLLSYNWYLMFVYSIIKSFTFARHNSAIICGNEVNVFLSRVFFCIFSWIFI